MESEPCPQCAEMRRALQEIGAHMCEGNRYRNMRAFPVMKHLVLKAANIANRALGYREIRFDDFESPHNPPEVSRPSESD